MMVQYFALLRDVTGKKEEDWRQPEATLGDLLHVWWRSYGPAFDRWVLRDGDLWTCVIILVNGQDVRHLQRLATPLGPDDHGGDLPARRRRLRAGRCSSRLPARPASCSRAYC